MNTEKRLVPILRFSEFNQEEWKEYKLDDIAQLYKGKGISKNNVTDNGTIPCIRYGELYTHYKEVIDKVTSYTDLPIDDLFMSKANDVIIPSSGETKEDIATASCVLHDNVALGGDINVIRTSNNGVFLSYYLNNVKKHDIAKIAQGISIIHLYNEQLRNLSVELPDLEEQQKIAECLSSIDSYISSINEKVEQLNAHKKSLMQKLFPQNGKTVPEYRFPEFVDNGDWEIVKLREIAVRVKNKNKFNEQLPVLTNSATEGIVNQQDYFDREIVTRDNLSNYFIVKIDDFVYNPRISSLAPVGPISRNKIERGIISPLYTIFRFCKGCIDYFDYYFRTNCWHQYLRSIANFGARFDRMNITNEEFMNMPIPFPSVAEQQKIAECLSSIDKAIGLFLEKESQIEIYKKGLMQQLFPVKK